MKRLCKKILAFVLAAALVAGTMNFGPVADEANAASPAGTIYGSYSTNIAKNVTAYASSNARGDQAIGARTVRFLTDTDNYTYIVLHGDDTDPWFYVDLGSSKNVNKVSLVWGAADYANAYATSYKIQYSDDAATWKDAATMTEGELGSVDVTFPSVYGRYIRVKVTGKASTHVSLYEMRVYETNFSVNAGYTNGENYRAGSGTDNIAAGKSGYASSNNRNGSTTQTQVNNLTDNNTLTYIVSHYDDANPYFYVDLGSLQNINKAVVYFGSDSDPYTATQPNSYDLQVSGDGTNWTTVKRVSDASYGKTTLNFGTVWARYVRVAVTDKWDGTDYVSMYELKVFNTDFNSALADSEEDPVRILFIGNSLTCYNNVSSKVQSIFEMAGKKAHVDVLIKLGQTLTYHASLSVTGETILNGNYDYVVLQDKASGFNASVLQSGAENLYYNYIQQSGAQPVLYMIWANASVLNSTQSTVTAGYVSTSRSIGAKLAPAGVSWQEFYNEGYNWYTDNIHANAIGSYMAAAHIYYAITGETTPLTVPASDEVVVENGFDVNLVNAIHNRACANTLQYNVGPGKDTIASVADGTYYLKGVNTGKVVCADNYGENTLIANRDSYGGEWEMFTVVNNDDGTISLLSGANNKYVCMVLDESCQLLARSESIGTWEKFYLVQVTDDQYALKSYINNMYVTVNENDSNNLYATAGSVQAWEVFHLYTTDGNQITASGGTEESTEATEPTETSPEETESESESESESASESESETQPSEESSSESSEESSEESEEPSEPELVKPSKITGVQAVYEDGKIKLTWDNNGAVQYRVMRFTSETGYTTKTYKATADGYIDTDLIEAQLYYYRICGYFYDAEGKLVQGNVSESAAVVATDKEPAQVTNLTADISDSGVTLNWDAADGVRYYKIARARGWSTAEGSYTCLKYNVSETAYTDKPESYGNWRYKVVGYYKNTDGSWVYGPMSATLFLTYEEPEEKPVEQKELSEDTINFYAKWKENYVVKNPYVTDETQYYVWYSGKKYSDNQSQVAVTVSEAHGYGMLTAVSMARYDSEAKEIFDGMYRYYRAHLSEVGPNLMAWQQADNGSALIDSAGANSATDGDLDIAYALLMADCVWGSDGEIDYKQAAINVINDIMTYEVNQEDWILRLGDWTYWSGKGDQYYAATRASDFIVQYMPVFAKVTNDDRWLNVYNRTYEIINSIVDQYGTGILPDFIVKDSSTGKFVPAPANFLESDYDGSCYYNSCRTPWRISMDYLINGNEDALNFATTLNTFIVNATGGNPNGIRAGYKLDGTVIGNYSDLCFTAPFVVAGGCGGFDDWHGAVRNHVVNHGIDSYYADSIKMLCLIADDGGWIVP